MFTARNPRRRFALAVCTAVAVVLAATACSSSNGGSQSTPAPIAEQKTVAIASHQFEMPPTVSPGTTVVVRNSDGVEHSVTSEAAGLFDVEVEAGETGNLTVPSTVGSYPVYCRYHPGMRATLVVE